MQSIGSGVCETIIIVISLLLCVVASLRPVKQSRVLFASCLREGWSWVPGFACSSRLGIAEADQGAVCMLLQGEGLKPCAWICMQKQV